MNELYFKWMYDLVISGQKSYKRLLKVLYDTEFYYRIPMDGNRYEDGIDLRYRFGYEHNLKDIEIVTTIDTKPCSVLEMMVALAIRCEEHIMDDPDIGDRTGKWFMVMINSLGLAGMTDDNFDKNYISDVLDRFLEGKYDRNGKGGLFIIKSRKHDMRKSEIWYQLMWYLNEEE